MTFRCALNSSVAAICIAGVAAPLLGAAPPPRAVLDVHVGEAKDFTRIELHWAGGGGAVSRRDGQVLTLSFNRDADPDIARLRSSPPRWLKTAEARHIAGRLQLALTLTEDADAKVGVADGATYVNLYPRPASEPASSPTPDPSQATTVEPPPTRPDPMPVGGVVHMETRLAKAQVSLVFPWANPNGAAVFRRGGAIWVVFDTPATIDISKAPHGLKQLAGLQTYKGPDYTAVRIAAPPGIPFFASAQGGVWTVNLGPGAQAESQPIKIVREDVGGPATLKAVVSGATRAIQFADPVVGDTLSVVTALGPVKGVPSRREYVQMAVLPSVQGLALESFIGDLVLSHDGDLVRLGRPTGLALSPSSAGAKREQLAAGLPKAASMPALIDEEGWPRTGEGGFLKRYNTLLNGAMAEEQKGKESPVSARMALARFLVGSQLSFEAIGLLNELARTDPVVTDNPEFRGLRGIARVMARRYKEAQADFASPVLTDDPSSALWRSYIAAQLGQWSETRSQFAIGASAFNQFSPIWKSRFARSNAQAALALGDLVGAEHAVNQALMDKAGPSEELAVRLVQAKLMEASGETERALRIYLAITAAPIDQLAAPALLRATQLRYRLGQTTPGQAAKQIDAIRFRWRGDATELEAIRALGQLHLSQGHYREALEALRSAGKRLPDLPEASQLQADLGTAFRTLFLDGAADGLEPIQALGLFYDFKELTPLGVEGDMMVRRLVRRLVDVDLLTPAAELLKYQVENRLEGTARSQVATDLAVIYLMDRKPEQALEAINGSRTTVLPSALNAQRRLIESRALMGLGRLDAALETIERDPSRDGQDLRAEVVWKQRNWAQAAVLFEKALGDRWKQPQALASEEEGKLLRAGVAYSLAGDDTALTRMRTRYEGFYDQAHNPEALRVALAGAQLGAFSVSEFGRISADNEAFAGWVAKMKTRFKERATPPSTSRQAAAATPQKHALAAPATRPAAKAKG